MAKGYALRLKRTIKGQPAHYSTPLTWAHSRSPAVFGTQAEVKFIARHETPKIVKGLKKEISKKSPAWKERAREVNLHWDWNVQRY